MSWQATAWVSKVEAGGASGKLLLYALANYADENGRTFAGDERIMRDTELSERAVRDWKRKLVDAGLITVERRRRPGGDFDLDVIQLAMECDQPPAKSAGGATGKSGADHRQMTPPPPANGAVPPTPPYIAEPPVEPPTEPIEREREREPEDRKTVERWLKRVHPTWPSFVADSGKTAFAAALALTVEERETAADRMADYLAAEKASGGRCAFGVYLAEKRWERLGPKPEAPAKPTYAPAFGPVWAAIRMRDLITGPKAQPAPLKGWELSAIENGRLNRETLEKGNLMRAGWPMVNGLHQAAETRGLGIHDYGPEEERLGKLCEFVPVDSDVWKAWKIEHELRGWPWLPDLGAMRGVYFPAGGPAGLLAFEQAVRGEDDASGCEAAA